MPRSGLLQDLPLESFNLPTKRPLSPGGQILFSPTKRRILNEVGIFSPHKTCKSTTKSQSPANVLRGPHSSARKLDLGMAKNLRDNVAPQRATKIVSLSRLKSAQGSILPEDMTTADCSHLQPSSSRASTSPILIPRVLPQLCDPQSVHYPGFHVYQDTHIMLTSAAVHKHSSQPADEDGHKENLPLRKRRRQVTSDVQLLSGTRKQEKAHRGLLTPTATRTVTYFDMRDATTPLPRRFGRELSTKMVSISKHLGSGGREARRMLEDEVDLAISDEDEPSDVLL